MLCSCEQRLLISMLITTAFSNSYEAIFQERGKSYHLAMSQFPYARKNEFLELFRYRPLSTGEHVLDVPSLGGYIKTIIPEISEVISLDFSAPWKSEVKHVKPLEDWNLGASCQRAVCLAAMHHMEDLTGFLENLSRHILPGGVIHLADVWKNSRIRTFLDGFVDRHTTTGHRGLYRDWHSESFPAQLKPSNPGLRTCPWIFKNDHDMALFCKHLFCIQDVSDEEIIDVLTHEIGVTRMPQHLQLEWELDYVELTRL